MPGSRAYECGDAVERLPDLRPDVILMSPMDGAQMSFKTIPKEAATSVRVATSPQLEGVGGRYFEDRNEAQPLAADAPLTALA